MVMRAAMRRRRPDTLRCCLLSPILPVRMSESPKAQKPSPCVRKTPTCRRRSIAPADGYSQTRTIERITALAAESARVVPLTLTATIFDEYAEATTALPIGPNARCPQRGVAGRLSPPDGDRAHGAMQGLQKHQARLGGIRVSEIRSAQFIPSAHDRQLGAGYRRRRNFPVGADS